MLTSGRPYYDLPMYTAQLDELSLGQTLGLEPFLVTFLAEMEAVKIVSKTNRHGRYHHLRFFHRLLFESHIIRAWSPEHHGIYWDI